MGLPPARSIWWLGTRQLGVRRDDVCLFEAGLQALDAGVDERLDLFIARPAAGEAEDEQDEGRPGTGRTGERSGSETAVLGMAGTLGRTP